MLIACQGSFGRQVGFGSFPPGDAPADGGQQGEDFAVHGVVVLLALGKYPHGLAGALVLYADFGAQLLDVLGGGVEGVAPHPASPQAVQEVFAGGGRVDNQDGPLRDARDDDGLLLGIEAAGRVAGLVGHREVVRA
ncbi:MAG: hypothetical protein AN484_15470 [Aphanizomenon flos-aquae WA102]|uniref:Uncharacterized protein n=1 Tax=Aphanizomenon flos-aquae WA102 TaxID=1710896 RepID=A0A1B7X0J7_APHFL|nr:MAG: hypothetical protein AN484_15470 [Aphanizomenon flos-aquae WA102]